MTIEELTLNGFIKEIKDVSYGPHSRKFCFVLGAGASKSSGIKSGQDLVEIWDKELEERNSQEHEKWKTERGINENNKASFYSEFYERRFKRQPADGYNYLEKLMGNAKPSIGYVMLAHLLTTTQHKVVITTNFDHLTEDAVNYYTEEIPLIIGHESLAHYVSHEINRPTIIKIHRDLLLDPKSKSEELKKLHDNWEKALETIFLQYHPIFIGYAGNDNSLMDFLIKNADKFEIGKWAFPYWLSYKTETISEKVVEFLEKSNGYLIKHDGFDDVLYLLGAEFDYKLPEKEKFLKDAEERFTELSDYVDEFTERIKAEKNIEQDEREIVVKLNAPESVEIEQAIQKITGQSELQRMFRESVFLRNDGDYDTALALGYELIEKEPKNARYHNSLGDTLYYLRRYDEALLEKRIAVELEPNNAQYHDSVGDTLYRLERYQEALEEYQKVLELEPEMAFHHFDIGRTLQELGRNEEALNAIRKAIEIDGEYALFYSELSSVLQEEGKYQEALDASKKAIELAPDYAWYYCELGAILQELEQYQDALSAYQKAIELDPNDAWYYFEIAEILNELGQFEEALSTNTEAIEKENDNAWYYYQRGLIFGNLKRYGDSIMALEKAVEMEPNEEIFKETVDSMRQIKMENGER